MKILSILLLTLFTTAAFAVPRTIDADRFKRVTGAASGSIMSLPDIVGGAELVCVSCTQTVTNKTLTAPIIDSAYIISSLVSGTMILGGASSNTVITNSSIVNPTITGGSISGTTNTNGSFTNAILTGGTVSGASIVNAIITGSTISGASNTVSINTSSITSGVLPIARGGTNNGALSVTAGAIAYTDGSKLVTNTPAVSSGQMLVSSGTVPVFVDIYSTAAISGTVIDWSQATAFTRTLAGNTTFSFSNPATQGNGKNIIVKIVNPSTHTVTWPTSATLKWAGGTAPVQTTNGTDVYTFFYDGALYFGSYVQDLK